MRGSDGDPEATTVNDVVLKAARRYPGALAAELRRRAMVQQGYAEDWPDGQEAGMARVAAEEMFKLAVVVDERHRGGGPGLVPAEMATLPRWLAFRAACAVLKITGGLAAGIAARS